MNLRLLVLVATLNLFTGTIIAQSDRPKSLPFHGVVRNAEGQPVKDCTVTLTAPSGNRYARFYARELIASRSTSFLTTQTNNQGEFQFTADLTDPKWNGAGEGLIIANDHSGALALQNYRLSRGLIDLPLELSLGQVSPTAVHIVDKVGKPLPGVRVMPARYGKNSLPLTAAERFAVISNDEGIVQLPASSEPLTAVFASSATLGNQFLLTQSETADRSKAVALASAVRKVHCVPPEGTKPTDIGRIEWHIFSFQKSNEQMELGWQSVTTNGVESSNLLLPEGSIFAITDARTGHGWMLNDRDIELSHQVDIAFKLQRALHVVGKVVAKENGRPLPFISMIEYYTDEPTFTRADGTFEMWLPKISDGTYPNDPLEEYFSEDAFFRSPQAEHAPGEAKIQPMELTRHTASIGTVLDAEGKPVAGVVVSSESKQERFNLNLEFLTDRNGSFRMFNLSDGTPVKFKVMDARGVTESPIEVTIDANTSPVLRLVKPVAKRFEGRIVDVDGKPIAGATVEVQLGQVSIAEGFRPAEYDMQDAFGKPGTKRSRFTTDSNGHFETDEVIDWQNVFGLKVTHPQHYETISRVHRVDKSPMTQKRFDFGELTMQTTPASQEFTVQVKDKSGAAVNEAKVLFIQGRDFAGHSQTGPEGKVNFNGKRTAGIVAARYQQRVTFATFTGDTPAITLDIDGVPNDQPWKPWLGSTAERRAVASKLLKKFEMAQTLDLNSGTEGEMLAVLDALIYTNPSIVLQLATTKRAELEKHAQITGMLIGQAVGRNPDLAPGLVPFMPVEYQHHLYLQLARKAATTNSTEAADDNLAQGLALTRKMSGDEGATATGQAAMLLLQRGEIDLATELVKDVYDNQKKDFEGSTDQKSKRGVARYYFPQLALVDLDVACELIHKHAYPNEIDTLQTLAVTLAVLADKIDWKSGLNKLGQTTLGDREATLVPGSFGETPLPNEKFVESLMAEIRNDRVKAMLCLQSAITLPGADNTIRDKWLTRGVELLTQSKPEFPNFFTATLAYKLRSQIPMFGKINAAATRQLAFLCLEELAEFRDGQYFYLPDRAGFVAEALVGIDPSLGRTLLQPFLEDFSWHYRTGFRWGPAPLTSAARVDPEWAATIAEHLIDEQQEDKPRQASVLSSVLEGLAPSSDGR